MNVGHMIYFVKSFKCAHKTQNFKEGCKFDFVLSCYLVTIVDYALEVLVCLYWAMVDRINVISNMKLLHVALTIP